MNMPKARSRNHSRRSGLLPGFVCAPARGNAPSKNSRLAITIIDAYFLIELPETDELSMRDQMPSCLSNAIASHLSRVPKVFARKLFEFMLGACEKHKVQQNSVSPATTGVD